MKNWKLILPLMMSGGLIACTSTPTTTEPVEPEVPIIEQPEDVPEAIPDTDLEPEVETEEPEVPEQPPVSEKPEVVVQQPEKQPETKPEQPPKVQKTEDGKLILGSEEWVYIPAIDQTFKGRIDTGATTSSFNATDVIPFERDGKDWVKFKVDLNGSVSREFKAPVVRWAKIRQATTEEVEERPVIVAYIQVGDLREKTEFTLAERGHMKFPILLGRSFFRDVAVVDVARKYVQNQPNRK